MARSKGIELLGQISASADELVDAFTARRPGVEERMAAGKALRERIPRASHGDFERPRGAVDPVAILRQQAKTRIPDLIPVRHARMMQSPFAFLRGSAA